MKKLAALMIILSIGAFTIGCGGESGNEEGSPGDPAAGEPPTTVTEPEGEDLTPDG